MASLLNDDIKKQVSDVFTDLINPVNILFFGQEENCPYCNDTRKLVEELVELSDNLQLTVYDLEKDSDVASQYNIDKAPGLVLAAQEGDEIIDFGIRYAGIPSGHEFSSLIHNLLQIASRDSGLNEKTRDYLKTLSEPLHLQVFVTPTCPHCPRAVMLAHQFAMESDMVQAEMVEATEFRDLSAQYQISGVPNTIINHGAGSVLGTVPEGRLLAELEKILIA